MGISHLSRTSGHDQKLKSGFAQLNQQATEIISDIANLSHKLRPVTLRVLGLAASLQSLCDEVKDPDGVNVIFTQQDQLPDLPWPTAIGLYRVAQEAVRNALTHSGSRQVDVAVAIARSALILTITDKGCGFAVNHERVKLGLGLTGMVERMNNVGGTLSIESTLTVGTTITASVALSELTQTAAISA
jgi:signal transduction histidine kinase